MLIIPNYLTAPRGFTFREKYPNDPIWGNLQGKYHLGLDLIIPIGTPLHAPFNGEIKRIPASEIGNAVSFSAGGFVHRLCHLSSYGKAGVVKEGDIIGYSGNTGLSTAPHLHHDISKKEVKINDINNFVDPLTFNYISNNTTMPNLYNVFKFPDNETVYGLVSFNNEAEMKALGKSFKDIHIIPRPTLGKKNDSVDVYIKQYIDSFDLVTPFGLSAKDIQIEAPIGSVDHAPQMKGEIQTIINKY